MSTTLASRHTRNTVDAREAKVQRRRYFRIAMPSLGVFSRVQLSLSLRTKFLRLFRHPQEILQLYVPMTRNPSHGFANDNQATLAWGLRQITLMRTVHTYLASAS
ncbi:hypothetical protein TRVL_01924 [Trypanosoma vivax]|nr:hypothetical protein TRVL_01924 [Trypanosoma vivax]